jgi:anthranilate synthase component 1
MPDGRRHPIRDPHVNPPLQRSSLDDARRHAIAWAIWPADLATPVRLFLALRAAGRHVCLLESVEGPTRLARYSFLGVDPTAKFRAHGNTSTLVTARGEERIEGSIVGALRSAPRKIDVAFPSELPPFLGGWIGWFASEFAATLEPRVPRARRDVWQVPDATLDLYDDVIALDHAAQKIYFIARADLGRDGGVSEREWHRAHERIDAMAHDALSELGGDARRAATSGDFRLAGEFASSMDPARYLAGVESLKRSIGAGDIFQAVLSQRFEQRFSGDPFTLYRVLRITNPSPHMFYFEADGLTLVGSSPERLVSVRGRRAENRPIAGTRPRAIDPADDERLGLELKRDPKERAEHDMLVDLARNDLGRVAKIGSVRVREHAVLERFARVQHLVSRVECDLAQGFDALDALAASFPAGTVSGAPKVRALQLIAELEPDTRGPYAGCFGYLDVHGNLDMAIVIRSFVARDGMLSVQAGAGIVCDSDPERELEETLHKARALFEAAGIADSDAFRSNDASHVDSPRSAATSAERCATCGSLAPSGGGRS